MAFLQIRKKKRNLVFPCQWNVWLSQNACTLTITSQPLLLSSCPGSYVTMVMTTTSWNCLHFREKCKALEWVTIARQTDSPNSRHTIIDQPSVSFTMQKTTNLLWPNCLFTSYKIYSSCVQALFQNLVSCLAVYCLFTKCTYSLKSAESDSSAFWMEFINVCKHVHLYFTFSHTRRCTPQG